MTEFTPNFRKSAKKKAKPCVKNKSFKIEDNKTVVITKKEAAKYSEESPTYYTNSSKISPTHDNISPKVNGKELTCFDNDFSKVPREVVDRDDFNGFEKATLQVLCRVRSTDGEGEIYPSIKTIARKAGFSESSIARSISSLKEKGIIKIIHRKDPKTKKQTSSIYEIIEKSLNKKT